MIEVLYTLKTRQGSPFDIVDTDQLHHFVLHYAKPLHDLEWEKVVITRTRFRIGSGCYNPDKIQNGIMQLKPGQDLEWDQAVKTQTRFRMGSGDYNPPEEEKERLLSKRTNH